MAGNDDVESSVSLMGTTCRISSYHRLSSWRKSAPRSAAGKRKRDWTMRVFSELSSVVGVD